jgi:hypothetical protein
MTTGIKIDFKNPNDNTQLIHAQFATIRSAPELDGLLRECARLDVAENRALKLMAIAYGKVDKAETAEEVDAATAELQKASEDRHAVAIKLADAVHAFVKRGFELGGSTPETAEMLADITPPERLAELKSACMFGAGALDFTKRQAADLT